MMHRKQHGFTLIELAIVLIIIGVLVGGFLGTFGARIDATRVANTRDDLESIEKAIIGYALSSFGGPALPCPDVDGDGFEDRNPSPGPCTAGNNVGALPWATLGVAVGDAWDTQYSYWVDTTFANNAAPFTLNSISNGNIFTRLGNNYTQIASNVVSVVISHGKNTYGGTDVYSNARPAVPAGNIDEADNIDANRQFVSREQTGAGAVQAGGEFDDIVLFISEYELKAGMAETGLLP